MKCATAHGQASQASSPNPIRVLFVKDRLHDTGGTLYFLEMLPRLDPARVTPLLCAFAPRHPIARRFEDVGIKPKFFGRGKWDPRCMIDVIRFARSCRADLLHLDGGTRFPFGRLGARATGLPAILRFNYMLPPPRVHSFLTRRVNAARWTGIAVSEAVREWAIRHYAIPSHRISVFHTARDVQRYASPSPAARDRVRGEFAIPHHVPVVGLVGRLDVAQKGQDVMVRAMSELRARCRDAVLLVVGDGPDRAWCEQLAHHLGLDGAVRFAGHRLDVADILAAVDVAVVPSMCAEASPFVAMEASAAGRPVVVFDSGGLPEVVQHGETGIVVSKGDVAGLAGAVAGLFEDPDLAMRLGEAGRRYAARFDLTRHVSRLMDFYDAVLDEHRRGEDSSSGARRGWAAP